MKGIIVEDEYLVRQDLLCLIEENAKDLKIVKDFNNGGGVLTFIKENKVDVVFMDINIPLVDGVNLGQIIKKLYNDIKLIFITAHDDFKGVAEEIGAFDYILKPYDEDMIKELIERVEK